MQGDERTTLAYLKTTHQSSPTSNKSQNDKSNGSAASGQKKVEKTSGQKQKQNVAEPVKEQVEDGLKSVAKDALKDCSETAVGSAIIGFFQNFYVYSGVMVLITLIFFCNYISLLFKERPSCKGFDDSEVSQIFTESFLLGFAFSSVKLCSLTFLNPALRNVEHLKNSSQKDKFWGMFYLCTTIDIIFNLAVVASSVKTIVSSEDKRIKACIEEMPMIGEDASLMKSLGISQTTEVVLSFLWKYLVVKDGVVEEKQQEEKVESTAELRRKLKEAGEIEAELIKMLSGRKNEKDEMLALRSESSGFRPVWSQRYTAQFKEEMQSYLKRKAATAKKAHSEKLYSRQRRQIVRL